MKITADAQKYLEDLNRYHITLIETTMQTCCSQTTVPRLVFDQTNTTDSDSGFSEYRIGAFFIKVHSDAEKYWEDGLIDLTQFASLKTLIVKHPMLDNSSCC